MNFRLIESILWGIGTASLVNAAIGFWLTRRWRDTSLEVRKDLLRKIEAVGYDVDAASVTLTADHETGIVTLIAKVAGDAAKRIVARQGKEGRIISIEVKTTQPE